MQAMPQQFSAPRHPASLHTSASIQFIPNLGVNLPW
jgi:hypothetical protein